MVNLKQDPYKALKNKLLATMIIVPFVPFILVLVIGYYHFTTSLHNDTISKMVRVVEDHRQLIEMFLKEREADLRFVADAYDFSQISRPEELKKVFANLQGKSPGFVDLGVFNAAGTHVAYQGPYELTGKDYANSEWFQQVMKQDYYISNIFLGYRRVPHFIIAIAKDSADGAWVLRATIDSLLFTEMVEKVRIGKTGEAYILNREGVFQTERRSGGSLMESDPDAAGYLTPHEGIETFVKKDVHGTGYLWATAWMNDNNWLLLVRQEEADAFSALRSASYIVVLISILGGVMIVAVAFYMTNRTIGLMKRADEEKSQLNQQLIVAGRLAEIGEMSAGFAHEINNPLQIIRAEQALVKTILSEMEERGDLKESEDVAEIVDSIDQIQTQVDRCAEVTQGLLKFARQKEHKTKDVDLKAFIPEVIGMVAKKASVEGININQNISAETPVIKADSGHLQQVLVNLLNNAIDAVLAEHGGQGGEIDVVVQAEDRGAKISVADNGCGIDAENMRKVFTPFFTTKPVGKGTGLGLSICYGIIDKMGGSIEVSSGKGNGTTFTIHMPAAS